MQLTTIPQLQQSITNSWAKIAPYWPLKNLVAVNPLAGFDNLSFEQALRQANVYFQQPTLPEKMQQINRETIKWLQAFFDDKQATIQLPLKNLGLLKGILSLIKFDSNLHNNDTQKQQWLKQLPKNPTTIISEILLDLAIPNYQQELFLTLILTTLPGWAAYIQYRTNWAPQQNITYPYPVTQLEYTTLRLILIYLIWPEAKQLLVWQQNASVNTDINASYRSTYQKIIRYERLYQKQLINKLQPINPAEPITQSKAQLVFCVDVRSEPFRYALEKQGDYQTFGFAGFFGLPITIEDSVTGGSYACCPVLLKPLHNIINNNSLTTPLSLDIGCIPLEQQITYCRQALQMIGLIENFAPLVIFCGHGSTTQNNAHATALNCGACAGRNGTPNARILAKMLNNQQVRNGLANQGLKIPVDTLFLAAEHNTTTDQITLYDYNLPKNLAKSELIKSLQQDLNNASNANALWRSRTMGIKINPKITTAAIALRARDWAQVRPEWGLANNAGFIIGPRSVTKNISLEGRCFLHSYEWEQDPKQTSLTKILTGTMIVIQWINAQYLFSTLDNIAFGGGSKITNNITGDIGVMQGNASDLMHGLPLQSVYKSDQEPYHQPLRLTVIVYAPRSYLDLIINQQNILQKLFGNGWLHLICYDPSTKPHPKEPFSLQPDLTWKQLY